MLWMQTSLPKVHSVSKLTLLYKILVKGSLMGALFLCLPLSAQESVSLVILDTGFCPNLIKTPKNVTIKPVQDVTQSVNYQCTSGNLNNRQFHGHWVLAEILNNLKPSVSLSVLPIVIFDKYGNQKLSYWKKAFQIAKDHNPNFIVAAAGLPINKEDKKLLHEASKVKAPLAPMVLAAGRKGKGISEKNLLFPQDFFPKERLTIFGSYHHGLSEEGPHFFDTALLRPKNIDLYLPFNFKPRLFGNLKGTSLSVAKGVNILLKVCKSPLRIDLCLKDELQTKEITAKDKDQKMVLKTLEIVP